MGAAGGEGPAEDAGLGLLDVPAGGLLGAVVGAAFGAEVALVGGALGVGGGVVEVGVDGLGLAAGGGAGGGAGADQVLELAARGVAVLGVAVVAGALGDRLEGDVQGAQEVGELRGLRGRRGGPVAAGGGGGLGLVGASCSGGAAGDQGCCPGEQPWAAAVPSGPRTVMHQRVWGWLEAARTMSLVSRGFRRPQPLAWDGVVSQPRRVPAWTRRLMTAGIGARTGASSSAGPDAVASS